MVQSRFDADQYGRITSSGIAAGPGLGRIHQYSTRILRGVLPLWERSHLVIEGISSNFKLAARISGIHILLGLLLAIAMGILVLSGIREPIDSIEKRSSLWLPRIGMILVAAGVLWNEFTVARFL